MRVVPWNRLTIAFFIPLPDNFCCAGIWRWGGLFFIVKKWGHMLFKMIKKAGRSFSIDRRLEKCCKELLLQT
jgi:hypothetical protein